eukprot:41236-Eustigmatos_ZCMA.PRE.1
MPPSDWFVHADYTTSEHILALWPDETVSCWQNVQQHSLMSTYRFNSTWISIDADGAGMLMELQHTLGNDLSNLLQGMGTL